jgi:tRNA modification GTPase
MGVHPPIAQKGATIMSDTIAAIASALTPSAIGIVRLSGSASAEIAGRVFTPDSGVPLREAPNRKLVYGALRDEAGRVIDRCLAVYTRGPRSYTGEDTVELQCHGAPIVLTAALNALFAAGARQAEAGEFTKRAFLNGRMDLTQCEAVVDLIDAETADAAANAAGQLAGAVSRRTDAVYDALRDVLAHFHVSLDYPDEDIEPFSLDDYAAMLRTQSDALGALLASFEQGRIVKNGVRAAILGRPNAGKSSLLNALAGYDRVIVTATPGTTRDTVEHAVRLGGVTVRLIDTAGIRETPDAIERMGVERAEQAALDCDLALFVCDAAAPLTNEDRRAIDTAKRAPRAVALLNKSDLPAVVRAEELPFETVLPVSAKTGAGLPQLADYLAQTFAAGAPCDGSLLTNARQADAVRRAKASLDSAILALELGLTPDAVLVDVEAAMQPLGELTGRAVSEDVTSRIFERFCVGK